MEGNFMKDYILKQIKYRELAGENKKDILLEMHKSKLITIIELLTELNIEFNKEDFINYDYYNDVYYNLNSISHTSLIVEYGVDIAEAISDIFIDIIDDYEPLEYIYNYRIMEIGNKEQEKTYNQALEKGLYSFYDKEHIIHGKKFMIGCNYKNMIGFERRE
jgi:hypothetical protein